MTAQSEASRGFRDLGIWPLRTERLSIRPATLEDAGELWRFRGIDAVGEWLGWHPIDRADWNTSYQEKYLDYLVVEREGRIIGDLMLSIADGWGQREVKSQAARVQAEIGWTLDPDEAGQGYATEAAGALLHVCFNDLGLRRVEAGAFAANEPSWRLMERLGMRRESYSVKESLHRDHGWIDGVLYAILAEEWHLRQEQPQ